MAKSVGEDSHLTARKLTGREMGTAVACKDGSVCEISDSHFDEVIYNGLMSYRKKAEYSFADMTAIGVEVTGTEVCCLNQTGSRLQVNGTEYKGKDVDIDTLYKSGYMQK